MNHVLKADVIPINTEIQGLHIAEALQKLISRFPGQITFSTSFSNEDQVITHAIAANKLNISIFTLDTGRLFHQTYAAWSSTIEQYGITIQPYYPNDSAIEEYVAAKGPNAFYSSVDNRKECCYIRKVVPLKRALAGNAIWITGLRAEHSPDRQNMELIEWDEGNQIIKYNPLLHWTTEEVKQYINTNNVPYNILHDRGFVSIGCEPCTRAIQPGEAFRAGRWWWEDTSKKECGLHTHIVKAI
jgi:phosphoadenosine phosphosulfate reductase